MLVHAALVLWVGDSQHGDTEEDADSAAVQGGKVGAGKVDAVGHGVTPRSESARRSARSA